MSYTHGWFSGKSLSKVSGKKAAVKFYFFIR